VLKLITFPFRALYLFFRLSGVKGGLLFVLGIAVGLLIAPQTGPELRARIQAKLADRSGGLPAEQEYNRL
jgi:hypothetical protein